MTSGGGSSAVGSPFCEHYIGEMEDRFQKGGSVTVSLPAHAEVHTPTTTAEILA